MHTRARVCRLARGTKPERKRETAPRSALLQRAVAQPEHGTGAGPLYSPPRLLALAGQLWSVSASGIGIQASALRASGVSEARQWPSVAQRSPHVFFIGHCGIFAAERGDPFQTNEEAARRCWAARGVGRCAGALAESG